MPYSKALEPNLLSALKLYSFQAFYRGKDFIYHKVTGFNDCFDQHHLAEGNFSSLSSSADYDDDEYSSNPLSFKDVIKLIHYPVAFFLSVPICLKLQLPKQVTKMGSNELTHCQFRSQLVPLLKSHIPYCIPYSFIHKMREIL